MRNAFQTLIGVDNVGAADLMSRGVTNSMAILRPVLSANAGLDEQIVGNATLRREEWLRVDERVNTIFRERLTVVDDIRSRGLVQPVSLGTILRITERTGDMDPADLSFDGDTAPTRDRAVWGQDTVPIPIISKEFQIGWRQLAASRERGEGLDTTNAEVAARKVRERMEDLWINGYGHGPDGSSIPGLRNAPGRITVASSGGWASSGARAINDVERMLAAAYARNLFGPFALYIPKNWWGPVQSDYSTDTGAGTASRTVRERILAFVDIAEIRPLDRLPDDEAIMVQLTRDVLDMSEAQGVTTVQWDKNPFVTNFRVLTVGGPHIKTLVGPGGSTFNGIIHLA